MQHPCLPAKIIANPQELIDRGTCTEHHNTKPRHPSVLLSAYLHKYSSPASSMTQSAPPGDVSGSLKNEFSDIIHGEDLEFRESSSAAFSVRHRIGWLGKYTPPKFIRDRSEHQLVTIAGAALGFVAGVVVCPLDVVKTRLQAQGLHAKYHGFFNAFLVIVREEGLRGLYRGVVPVTIGYLPTWAIYFTMYERSKRFYPDFLYRNFGINKDTAVHVASSVTAGACSSFLVNPIWVVKTRLMIQTGKEETYYKGTLDAFRQMYKNEGFRVFYLGIIPSLFGLVHVGIHFPVYEAMKKALHCDRTESVVHLQHYVLWRLILASSASKMIASTITYPHEILRTRMQMVSKTTTRSGSKKPGKLVQEIKLIFRKDGVRGFYAGYATNLARTLPASAVTLVSFEYFKTYLLEISGKI